MSRTPLVFLALLLPVLASSCAESEPRVSFDPDPGPPVTEAEPTEPPPMTGGSKPTDPDEAAVPEVEGVSPDRAVVGSVGPTLIVTGNNFVPRSIVQLDGAPLATSFVSGTELRATVPSGKLAAVGTLRVSVGTAPPGGGASKEVAFTVDNPSPQVMALSPLSVLAGSGATQLAVSGLSFVQGAKIRFGSTELPTTVDGATELSATVPAALLGASGTVPVTVTNPAPGGGTSAPISFTISNPSATIQGINPSAAFVGAAPVEVTVTGSGFVSGSKVLFNAKPLSTTFVSASTLKAQVPAASLTAAGDFPVVVENPDPGGGPSMPVVFRVQYPAPSATSLSPSSSGAGSAPREVTVTGVGFFVTSQITFDNAPASTTYIDATHLKATLTAAQLASAGTISVRVVTPAPGGGTSAALAFTVSNAVPKVTSLSPSTVAMGSPSREITIHGSGFVSGSSVTSNGQVVTSKYVSGGQLKATIPANHLLNYGSVTITVTNPAPGGGSADAQLAVGCDTSDPDVIYLESLFESADDLVVLDTKFDHRGLESRWAYGDSCQTAPLYSDVLQPGRYAVVQNTVGVPITLSAAAYCEDGKGDAFLTFYKRPTIPANDDERLGCAFWVSNGRDGGGGFSSPFSYGSQYCPGLTKANGGGIQLGVCERAVVHIQSFNYLSTTNTPPPYLVVYAE